MLDNLFQPRSICLVGASDDSGKIGNVILRNLITAGYQGKILPVNPSHSELLGIKCYSDIKSIPYEIDLCVISIPAKNSIPVVRDAVSLKVPFIVMIPGGFAEAGDEGKSLQEELRSAIDGSGTRIIGPNTVGIYIPKSGINTTLTPTERVQFPPPGSIAIISQSGALGLLTMDTVSEYGTGIHSFVNLGNRSDLDELDFLQYLSSKEDVKGIAIYLESVSRGKDFLREVKEIFPRKPVVVLKSGRTQTSARAASLHTASMATDDRIAEGVFRQAGIIRAENETELMDFVRTLSYSRKASGNRVAVVTSAGGVGVVTADLISMPKHPDLRMADLSDSTIRKIRTMIVPFGSAMNPVDITADGSVNQIDKVLSVLNDAEEVDIIVLYALPQTPKMSMDLVDVVVKWKGLGKPLLVGVLGFKMAKQMIVALEQNEVPVFPSISRTVRSAEALSRYNYYTRRVRNAVH
ncbi:MAG: CoA-binding protein [Candidatus Thermoplasmatota archaeon]|nr:CoA-binding protein [Candidatus Thermoplasmatota archaeon]